jgi:hypothetical protein
MADGIYDIDINKLLGINPTLPQGLLENDPNLATDAFSKQIFGGLEGLTQAQQNYAGTPETILRTLLGMKTGRQAAYDAATKRYQTRQDILKDQLGIKKLTGEVEMQPYQKRKLMIETGDAENKFYESSIRAKSIKTRLRQLEEQGRYAELDRYAQNPDEFIKMEAAADIKNKVFDDDTISAAMSIGLNPNNRDSWREQDWANLDILLQAPDAQEANEQNLKNRQAHAADRSNVPLVQIKDRNTLAKEMRMGGRNVTLTQQQQDGQPQQQSNEPVDLEFYSPTFSELQKGKIKAGTDPRFPNGVVFGSDGLNYTEEQWNSMGKAWQLARRKGLKTDKQQDLEQKTFDNAQKAGAQKAYLFDTIQRSNKAIEEILSKPEFLKDLASVGGRAITNLNLGKYGFTSDVQDIKNLFSLVRNKQFIREIQDMRANNDTGGAVGNVSNFEVEMFMNAAAALQDSSSASFMYNQLANLHDQSKKAMERNLGTYTELYGNEFLSTSGLNYYDPNSFMDIPSWEEATNQSGRDRTAKKNITVKKLED